MTGEGRRVTVASPAAWWLSDAPLFDGSPPAELRLDADELLEDLFDLLEITDGVLDHELLRAVGVATTVEELLSRPAGAEDLLARLSDSSRTPSSRATLGIYRAISLLPEERWPEPPKRVRVFDGSTSRITDADDAVVVVAPHHAPLIATAGIPGTRRLADILDVRTSDEVVEDFDPTDGNARDVPQVVHTLLPNAPLTYVEHDDLEFEGQSLSWWVTADGAVHAATLDGLARGLAWAGGAWTRRWELAAVLDSAERVSDALVERAFDES